MAGVGLGRGGVCVPFPGMYVAVHDVHVYIYIRLILHTHIYSWNALNINMIVTIDACRLSQVPAGHHEIDY